MNRTGWQFYGWWGIVLPAFLVIWVTNALTLAGLNVFDAKLLAELGVERGPLKFGDTIQLLVSGALAPVGGWLADRYGVRPVMVAGVLLLSGGLFGYSFVDSLADVYLMRVLTGAALAGGGLVICVTIVSRWFVAKRGTTSCRRSSPQAVTAYATDAHRRKVARLQIGDTAWK